MNFYSSHGVPEAFGIGLCVLATLLLAWGALPPGDYGKFKVPVLSRRWRMTLAALGSLLLLSALAGFLSFSGNIAPYLRGLKAITAEGITSKATISEWITVGDRARIAVTELRVTHPEHQGSLNSIDSGLKQVLDMWRAMRDKTPSIGSRQLCSGDGGGVGLEYHYAAAVDGAVDQLIDIATVR